MKNLPEGAGSPISRMPQTTEGGLRPTHQPILLIHQPFCLLTAFFRLPKQHNTLRSSDNILPTLLYQLAGFLCIFSRCVVVTFSVIVNGGNVQFVFTSAENKRHDRRVRAQQLIDGTTSPDKGKYLRILYDSSANLLSFAGYTTKSVYEAVAGQNQDNLWGY